MGILSKMLTALRGGITEAGEAVVAANDIRIFEQEVRDAKGHIHKAKLSLTNVMAEQMAAERRVSELTAEIKKHEEYVVMAIEKNNETLALNVAEKIAELESDLVEAQEVVATNLSAVKRLKELVKNSEKVVKDNERQISMIHTTESVQKATSAASSSLMNSTGGLSSAKESLNRIKERQQKESDRMLAAQTLENGDGSLESKLKEAGISSQSTSASDVLARIKAKNEKV